MYVFVVGLRKQLTPVAFFAYRSSNLVTSSSIRHKKIIYDKVDLNTGDGYNRNTGKFTNRLFF